VEKKVRAATESLRTQMTSRRRVPAGSGALLGGGALLSGSGIAAEHGGGMTGSESEDEPGTDVDVLNYALTLEKLEDAFYRDAMLSEETTMEASALEGLSDRVLDSVYGNLQDIGAHESTHVDVLVDVIETLGGEPVSGLEFEFGIPKGEDADPDKFLATAQALENTGVMAYDGALPLIESPDLQRAGATIATVEARHASCLNLLNGDDPFPAAFDEAKSMEEILDVAGGFIVDSGGE